MSLLHPNFDVCGFDLSSYQRGVDWNVARSKGSQFAIIKGGDWVHINNKFLDHVENCKRNGIPWGAYWFWRMGQDPMKAATTAYDAMHEMPPLGWWLDVENHPQIGDASVYATSKSIYDFLTAFDAMFGELCGVYTRKSVWDYKTVYSYRQKMRLEDRPLWVSRWPLESYWDDPGELPVGFADWIFWQFSGDEGVHANRAKELGILDDELYNSDDDIDINAFNGDQDLFDMWAGVYQPPEPPDEEVELNEFEKLEAFIDICQSKGIQPNIEIRIWLDDTPVEVVPDPPPVEPPVEPPDEPPPPVVVTKTYTVTDEKTLAHKIVGWNDRPKEKGGPLPILGVYPTDKAEDVNKRYRFDQGETVKVYPEKMLADAGFYWYELVDYKGDGQEKLYVAEIDGKVS